MKILILFCFVAQLAFAQIDVLVSKEKNWNATLGQDWYTYDRETLLETVMPFVQKCTIQKDVQNILGEPQSIWNAEQKTWWTYGLSKRSFLNIVFDSNGRVIDKQKIQYRPFQDQALSSATNIESATSNPLFDIAALKALAGKGDADQDRVQLMAGVARVLNETYSDKMVEAIFGKPDHILDRGHSVWIYRIRASTFFQIIFFENKQLLGAYIRHYDRNTGRLNLISLCGVMERPQEDDLDVACWQSTVPGYINDTYRTGIGVRMSRLITPGMTKNTVLNKLGKPSKIISKKDNSELYQYDTSLASLFTVNFDPQGEVTEVFSRLFPQP